MNDYNRAVTLEDLIRKYNLDGMQKKVSKFQGELINTNGILEDFVETTTENLDLINNQLDGNVTSWFYNYVPTLLNIPASNWTTDELKDEHLEDLFYDANTGKVYKFVKDSDTYQWMEVTNIIGAQTFAIANASQDVIDGNRRTFFTTPTPPYDVGDLWADNTNHILYRCLTPKATGETFLLTDWVDSLKYLSTDDGDKLVDSINSRKTTKTISADKLFIEGDEINMTSKQLSIKSDNFDLDSNGSVLIKNTDVMGGTFRIDNGIVGRGNKYSTLTADCLSFIRETGGIEQYFYLGNDSIGGFGMHLDGYVFCNTLSTHYMNMNSNDLMYECTLDEKYLDFYDYNSPSKHSYIGYDGCSVDGQVVSTGGMFAPFFQQTSLEEEKKNIELANIDAIDLIKNIDIYKFNYKFEEDNNKKHYGFVIGDKYNYSEEITGNDNKGTDLYSFISVCCKAIQEQQKEIEELKEEINKLKGGSQ